MTCEQAEPLLARAADGALDPQGLAALTVHLSGCAECRDALDAQRAARALLAARPAVPAPAGFSARVMAALPAHPPAAAGIRWRDALDWRAWTLRLAPVTGALFLGAALGLGPSVEATADGAVEFTELAAAWTTDNGEGGAGSAPDPVLETVTELWQDGSEVTDDVLIELLAASPE